MAFPHSGHTNCTPLYTIGSVDTLRISIAYDDWDFGKLRFGLDLSYGQ